MAHNARRRRSSTKLDTDHCHVSELMYTAVGARERCRLPADGGLIHSISSLTQSSSLMTHIHMSLGCPCQRTVIGPASQGAQHGAARLIDLIRDMLLTCCALHYAVECVSCSAPLRLRRR